MLSTPVVKRICDPSSRYAAYRRRTIQNAAVQKELRILACVYNQENVPSILNLLAATHPTKDGSVCIYVLELVELVGRAASVLVEHDKQQKNKQLTRSHSRVSEKITSAFNKFEHRNQGFTIEQSYTAVSPFTSMHNDVCEIAMNKRTNLVIIPFSKLAEDPVRGVNLSILHKAPCAVGILFDHINVPKSVNHVFRKRHNVAVIFIGGPDDREALTYSMRIALERHLKLSVIRFTHSEVRANTTRESKKDDNLIEEFQKKITNRRNIVYKEEEVTDCGDTATKIRHMEETHDFILVGRQHDNNSPILSGLDQWCVYKELGVIGDLLVTSSVKGNYSVLILIKKMLDKPGANTCLQIAASFGFLYFSFLVGAKIDMDMLLKANKRTYIVGFSNFIIPLVFNTIVCTVMRTKVHKDLGLEINLVTIAVILSVHSFHDTASALDDLNLLNSEIGRLSLSISIFTGLCSWLLIFVLFSYYEAATMRPIAFIFTWVSRALIMLFMFSVRPMLLWMIRTTPEGTTLKETYVAVILISVMASAFYSEAVGLHAFFGPVMIGMVVPVGSPIGEAVQKKIECFITMVLLPAAYLVAGSQVNVYDIQTNQFAILELLIFLAWAAKLAAIVLPCLYCSIPIQDALSLGLILQCDGTFNLLILSRMHRAKYLDEKSYTIAVLTGAFITMVSTPIVKRISDPSKRLAEYRKLTIRNSTVKKELRILACVYHQENVPSILNFLAATHPTKDGSVCIYVLQLFEQVARVASLLVAHDKQQNKKQLTQSHSRVSEKITSAFDKFEQRNPGFTIGQSYTAMSPFVGMHNNVCEIAMDKRINLVIIPFVFCIKHLAAVGILFDHINVPKYFSDASRKCRNVAMIFIGGPDDREALTYSMRIADEPHLKLSVFRFTHSEVRSNNNRETKRDNKLIKELRERVKNATNIVYKEEEVTDCGDTAGKIRLMEESHDFILVGRQHDNNSPILLGLDQWCVHKELGVIGDLLVTSSFKGNYSVLIMKQ
ncbi:hypothetical protein MKW94_027673 [Papaver nudicaule]|uniref:Cation/H+ exchanger domain-containing protein n=1 Tax=Papaver nudicaule TaxID=74823 RepID=A0AA41V7P7_PAPNU|nr:hypothetical protein [Papaver nudicaule]